MRARTPNVLIQFITKQATPHGRKHPARDPNQEPHIVTLIKTRTTKQGKIYINTIQKKYLINGVITPPTALYISNSNTL
jgi:hypothetical protein